MEFRDSIRAVKSEVSDFYQTRIKSQSSGRAKDLKKLDEVDGGKNPLSQAVHKCKVQYRKLYGENVQINYKDFDELSRTQEHLFPDLGGRIHYHVRDVKEHLENEGSEYEPLRKELDSFVSAVKAKTPDGNAKGIKPMERPMFPGLSVAERSQSMRAGVGKLKDGESILIDAGAFNSLGLAGGHAMIMRLTRNSNNSFKMEFANTGIGIRNENFHPKSSLEPHKCQTVAVINDITSDKLLDNNFFETYCSIAAGGGIPENSCLIPELRGRAEYLLSSNGNASQSLINRIDALYLCLGTLGNPRKEEDENSGYYSRPQIGSSCAASSLWAISKVILPEASITKLDNDLKLKSLLRNYKLIENGYDQSSTRKIMVLDQVESLKHIYKGDAKTERALDQIEAKLKRDLGIDRVESRVKKGKIPLNIAPAPNVGKGVFDIKPMRAKLTPRSGKLKQDVAWTASTSDIRYNVVKNSDNQLAGEARVDSMYLLYFAIANGDQAACADYIKQVVEKNPNFEASHYDRNVDIYDCLFHLVSDLSGSNTRSDIAKKYFLGLLMESNNPSHRMDPSLRDAYIAMDVEAHLGNDNIWVQGIMDLSAVREAPKLEAANLATEQLAAARQESAKLATPEAKYAAAMTDRNNAVRFRLLLADAAAQGHVKAQFELGQHLWRNRKFAESVKYLQPLADQGNLNAQRKMGGAYSEGVVDLETAIKYSLMAANQGDGNAKIQLGELYFIRGDPRDLGKVVEYSVMAAKQGNVEAQKRLGKIYQEGGDGVPRDLLKAIQYYQLAGDTDAGNLLISDPTSRSEILKKALEEQKAQSQENKVLPTAGELRKDIAKWGSFENETKFLANKVILFEALLQAELGPNKVESATTKELKMYRTFYRTELERRREIEQEAKL